MAHKILSKDRVETNKNVKREMEREREMGKGGGRGREREGEGRVMYTIHAPFGTIFFRKRGWGSEDTNSGMETKIHIKTAE